MKTAVLRVAMMFVVLVGAGARGDDVFYRVAFDRLQITEGAIPVEDDSAPYRWDMYDQLRPYAILDGQGEAYVVGGDSLGPMPSRWTGRGDILVVRAPSGESVAGSLFLPTSDWSGMAAIRFSIAPDAVSPQARHDFYAGKEAYYSELQFSGKPGTAWFRRQATEAHRELGPTDPEQATRRMDPRGGDELSDTYNLFVGGRAMSENLQLNRDLAAVRANPGAAQETAQAPVPVSSIDGITVQEMDWTALLGDAKPEMDALASAIPADQHAVFFASFDALMTMADETSEHGLPVFRAMEQRSVDGHVVERYERQLCLQPSALARLLGPKVVKSVAITGSDPYFPTGTDVAVVFEAADAKSLRELILTQARLSAVSTAGAQETSGEIGGVKYTGLATPDRSICSYVATIGDAVVVTNSIEQIRRLAAVPGGSAPSIASLPEYRFFRTRYPLGAEGETGLAFLSDATIRRWCGPEWRIGASRRIRVGAVMADVDAAHMDDLVRGLKDTISVDSDTPMATIGTLTIGPGGARSSVYGSTGFITPIVELGIKEVTNDEAVSYKRWRDGYQRNWRWAFDPICISFSVSDRRLSADVSVMPLIIASQYSTFLEFGRGAAIGPDSGDPHDAIVHAVFAVNPESMGVTQANGIARSMIFGGDIDPLGWLGKSVALYADPDSFWDDMLKAPDIDTFLENNYQRLPVAINAEVGSSLKLAAFLVAAHGFIDQAVPGMTAWETRQHGDQPYVRMGLTEQAKAEGAGAGFDQIALYYAATPKALILSLNEDMLKRALDRQAAGIASQSEVRSKGRPRPWLGSSLCAQFSRHGMELINFGLTESRRVMQRSSWSNIAILNEWKRRYPDQDPVRLHEARWGVRLVDPAGGQYVWNSQFRTMESTTYGHPGQPQPGPEGLGPLNEITFGNAGVTFADNGLRAKAVLERDAAKP